VEALEVKMGGREIPWDEPVYAEDVFNASRINDAEYENKIDRRHALHMAVEICKNRPAALASETVMAVADEFYGWLQSVAVEPGGLEDEAAEENS
jgi:hypothetical protein